MDTSWIDLPPNHVDYIDGVINFLKLAKENLVEGRTRCPCKKCKVDKWLPIDEVEQHILFKGFYKSYKNWIHHGKDDMLPHSLGNGLGSISQAIVNNQPTIQDDMEGLLNAAFGSNIPRATREGFVDGHTELNMSSHVPFEENRETNQSPNDNEENEKYQRLLKAADEELYSGCSSFSKLSFLLNLFHLKCSFHWSAESFNMLLKLLHDAFPQIKEFPTSYYESKKVINELGLGYEKIHACPNNCVLYWGDSSKLDCCPTCKTSRWKLGKGKENENTDDTIVAKKGEPAKVMRYFPLIPRLKRIYMSSKTAENMRWHDKDRVKDGKLRHPADALAWANFDDLYPEFAADPRNVRLALASDGFNPYRLMNTTYSTWPVILIPYNLPPWLVMKSSSFILSMIIPGKSGPGNDIDVYLRPLLHELRLLWEGVPAFDAYIGEWFRLRATLMCTINDFPAYAMLAGWSTKGYNACPSCMNSTHSYMFGGKICYCGFRRWLSDDHEYRSQGELFDGSNEYGHPPVSASGTSILRQQEAINYVYGKSKKVTGKKRSRREVGTSNQGGDTSIEENNNLWIKRSIFFDLPYWEHTLLRHNLDVMHIEKNVCDVLLGTLLGTDKSRDDVKARLAIKQLGVKHHLWLQERPNQDPIMPPAAYTMSKVEKERFLRVLQKLKVPDGYGSNLSRCVNLKQRKLMGLKSHDNHVLMQDILPVALRASKATQVVDLISDLSSFFKYLCSTSLDLDELDVAQQRLIITLCEMEKEFLPSLFTIMVHLLVHLVDEAKLGGPVHYRWMYPIERYLAHLKSYVSNKAQPEGSIAEGYILEETTTFCSRYLESVETKFNKSKRNDDTAQNLNKYLYNSGGRVVGKTKLVRLDDRSLKQAHRYVLLHSDEINDLKTEFIHQKQQNERVQADEIVQNEWIINEMSDWLQNQVYNIDTNTEEGKLRKVLASGLNKSAKRFKAFMINGYKFHTIDREEYRKTQNSGVMVEADGHEYYGKIVDIYELDYYGSCKVVVFRCQWVDINRGLKTYDNGGACVNFSKLMHTGRFLRDDPFIFSSQAKQVFFVQDDLQKGWFHVIRTKPRDLFDLGEDVE